jgi:phenylalanyl-tRNA synthetase beta chain
VFNVATIDYSVADLKGYGIDKDRLPKLVESLGMEVVSLDDGEAVLDITPNRPDLLDMVGFARSMSFFSGRSVPKENFYSINNQPIMEVEVGKAVKRIRPFIAAFAVKGIDLSGNRLKYLINFTEKFCDTYGRRRKKIAMGLHNLDVVKGPLRYDAVHDKSFVPLGSDKEKSFAEIIASDEKGMEYGSILATNNPKELYPYFSDSNNVLSMPPIINSELTRVKSSTKNLLVDITGPSLHAVTSTASLFACSFIDSGAEVYPCIVSYGNKKIVTPELTYKESRIKKLSVERTIGAVIEEGRMIGLLNRMGYIAAKYGNYILVYTPPYRLDVLNEQDITEDVAIAYGYENIAPLPVVGFSIGVAEDYREFFNSMSELMIGLGFSEAMNVYLTSEKLNFDSLTRSHEPDSFVGITYSKTEAATMLRTSVLPQLLQNLGQSVHERMPQRLFEIGSTFSVEKGKVKETQRLCFVSEHSKANFSEIRSVIEVMVKHLGLKKYLIKEHDDAAFIKGRCASIEVGGKMLGYFGEIAPQVLENFKLEEPVVAAELRMDIAAME